MNEQYEIRLTDKEQVTKDLRDAVKQEVGGFRANFFATLTFRKNPGEKYRQIFEKFQKRIDSEIYGNRSKKAVELLPIYERVSSTVPHFHIHVKNPFNRVSPYKRDVLLWDYKILRIAATPQYKGCIYDDSDLDQLLLQQIFKRAWIEVGKKYGRVTGVANFKNGQAMKFIQNSKREDLDSYSVKEILMGNEEAVMFDFYTRDGLRIHD